MPKAVSKCPDLIAMGCIQAGSRAVSRARSRRRWMVGWWAFVGGKP